MSCAAFIDDLYGNEPASRSQCGEPELTLGDFYYLVDGIGASLSQEPAAIGQRTVTNIWWQVLEETKSGTFSPSKGVG